MANYTCATRTNYFRVNDAENFKAFMARAYGTEDRVDLWEEKDKDGNTVYALALSEVSLAFVPRPMRTKRTIATMMLS